MPTYLTMTKGTRFDGPDIRADSWDEAEAQAGDAYEVVGELAESIDLNHEIKRSEQPIPDNTIHDRVTRLIADIFNVDAQSVARDKLLCDDLGFDSLDEVELLMELENDYGILIPDEEAVKWRTVGDAIDFIEKVASDERRKCRACGCTDDDCSGCIQRTGKPCHWIEHDLCSACGDTTPAA